MKFHGSESTVMQDYCEKFNCTDYSYWNTENCLLSLLALTRFPSPTAIAGTKRQYIKLDPSLQNLQVNQ